MRSLYLFDSRLLVFVYIFTLNAKGMSLSLYYWAYTCKSYIVMFQ